MLENVGFVLFDVVLVKCDGRLIQEHDIEKTLELYFLFFLY